MDNGRVSFSNPPRQSLFRHEDCLHGGSPKASTAARRALEIAPYADVRGLDLGIPMPGHRIDDRSTTAARIEELRRLVAEEHDVIFLLTDSRESRWLPTVLGAAYSKLVITIALGFDSYVAMRHGLDPDDVTSASEGGPGEKLGCYFCSDPRGPTDTLSNRTLDQQCTVTRPGVAYLAAAAGVELWASILQHPQGARASAISTDAVLAGMPADASLLGVVPHQVRGFVGHQQMMQLVGEAFNACTACSPRVQQAVRHQGVDFILRALEEPDYLAQISGASQFLDKVLDTDSHDNSDMIISDCSDIE